MSDQRVGVVGDIPGSTVEAAGATPVVAPAGELDTHDLGFVVAGGELAVVDLAREGVSTPVLPVEAGAGLRSVPRSEAVAALRRVLDGGGSAERHPVIDAAGCRAVFDVALVAAEPARISEFSVRYDGEHIARFRADGVVASTPAGTTGYNSAAGGPVAAPGTGIVAVVPIAPFATDADQWVLPLDAVTLGVERDETPVELLADGRSERTVATGDPVALRRAGDLETLVVPESGPFF